MCNKTNKVPANNFAAHKNSSEFYKNDNVEFANELEISRAANACDKKSKKRK